MVTGGDASEEESRRLDKGRYQARDAALSLAAFSLPCTWSRVPAAPLRRAPNNVKDTSPSRLTSHDATSTVGREAPLL